MSERNALLFPFQEDLWQQLIRESAPTLFPQIGNLKFLGPGMVDSFSDDPEDSDSHDFLNSILGKGASNDELIEWHDLIRASSRLASRKRSLTLHALDHPEKRHASSSVDISLTSSAPTPEEIVVTSFLAYRLHKWPDGNAPGRKKKDRVLERDKWLSEASNLLTVAGFPIAVQIHSHPNPDRLLKRLAGDRKASTIHKRVLVLRKVVNWMQSSFNIHWPRTWMDIVDYLNDLADQPCGPSVPQSVLNGIDFLESMAGLLEESRLARHPLVIAASRDIKMQVSMAKGMPRITRRAPPLLLAMVVSLEFMVMDVHKTLYARIYCWTRLLRHWCLLRWSDLLNTPPHLARLRGSGVSAYLELTITQTKTTGPGRKVETVFAYCSGKAFISESEWLITGWTLFTKANLGLPERPFWLPLPDRLQQKFSMAEPSYSDAVSMTRRCFSDLPLCRCLRGIDDGVVRWQVVEEDGSIVPLFFLGFHLFWREHGDRSTLKNWALILKHSKTVQDMLGRWSPEGSDVYIRTARITTLDTQAEIALQVREGRLLKKLGEIDTTDKMVDFLRLKNVPDITITTQVSRFSMAFPPIRTWDDEDDGFGEADDDEFFASPPPQPTPDSEDEPSDLRESVEGEFVVCFKANRTIRTLHRVGSCWRRPGVHFQQFKTLDRNFVLDGKCHDEYNRMCRDCFKPSKQGGQQNIMQAPEEDDSSSSSSGSSSS